MISFTLYSLNFIEQIIIYFFVAFDRIKIEMRQACLNVQVRSFILFYKRRVLCIDLLSKTLLGQFWSISLGFYLPKRIKMEPRLHATVFHSIKT